jgi:thiamine biosynthesis lipoprotein
LAALVASASFVGGCQQSAPSITTLRGQTMGTAYTIKVVLPSAKERLAVEGRLAEALDEFDLVFSTYNPKSEISRFNAHVTHEPFVPTRAFRALVVRALDLAKRTRGAFDPTVGPVLRLYGFGPGGKKPETPPNADAVEAARKQTGWQRIHLSQGGDLTKEIPTLELDLNAIAKGAGVDVVAKVLDGIGCASYMVEIGGEVSCRGRKPDGKAWRLGVALPSPAGGPVDFADKVDLVDRAMATSGSYMQFRDLGKDRVHHILDPRTGRNAESKIVSVTVIAKTCELADGLATAMMVLGPDEGEKVLSTFAEDDVKVLFLVQGEKGIERRTHHW